MNHSETIAEVPKILRRKTLPNLAAYLNLVANASQCTATNMPLKSKTLHIYGNTVIPSQFCQACNQDSFVIHGKLACCGQKPEEIEKSRFRIETDKSGVRRKLPTAAARREILQAQENRCFYCGDEFGSWRKLEGKVLPVTLNWDHLIPYSFDRNNLEFVAACRECNHSKYSLVFSTLEEAKAYLSLRMHEKKTATRKT